MRGKKAQASRKTRRDFLQSAALGLTAQALLAGKASARPQTTGRATGVTSPAVTTDSDVGSLFPFIQSQAPEGFQALLFAPGIQVGRELEKSGSREAAGVAALFAAEVRSACRKQWKRSIVASMSARRSTSIPLQISASPPMC